MSGRRHRVAALVGAALVATTLIIAPVVGVVPSAPARAATVASGSVAAVRYGRAHHMSSGIAVIDMKTGALYSAGSSTRRYSTASIVKTLIAARLLLAGRMHGGNARLARFMITQSDNAAASTLYAKVGRDTLLPWLAQHYRIHGFGAKPTRPGYWGTTQVTARGMARFYAAVRKDPKVWPWLSKAMHAYRARSSAGEPNNFGIAAAAPKSAVKNGWVAGPDAHSSSAAIINTTGFVDHDRYAVVILSEGPGSLYYSAGERIVSHEAKLVMPHGTIRPIPAPTVAGKSHVTGPTSGGRRITVFGTSFIHVTAVRFGSVRGRSVHVLSAHKLQVTAPPHPAGRVDVRVTTAYGTSRVRTTDRFTFYRPVPTGSR